MDLRHFEYGSDRPSEDVEISFSVSETETWIISFVATVPHHCESHRIFGDLFSCSLDEIDCDTQPVRCGSETEITIIKQLEHWANQTLTAERQDQLLNAKFTMTTAEMSMQKGVLWFIEALKVRRKALG